ncbi:MAG: hypothetical protein IPP29_03270 [Bacteroidetes bacterium]|nr:hypothetical protein [Bacteroidota bacterium]
MKKIVTVITILNLIFQINVSAQQILPSSANEKKYMYTQMKRLFSSELKNIKIY